MTAASALEASEIRVSFGGVQAVDGVSLSVEPGSVVGVIGPNGSGKTSLLNALTGVVAATGELAVDGKRARLGRPRALRRAGLVRTFQAPQVVSDMTCLDNVLLSPVDRRGTGVASAWLARPWMQRAERNRAAHAAEAMELVGLADKRELFASALTYGQARLLDLARAITGEPRVLMLDEPSAGLNEAETEFLADLLRTLRSRGTAILLVDHKVDFVDSLCQRLVVLQLGGVIANGSPREVWADARVRDAYLGVADAQG